MDFAKDEIMILKHSFSFTLFFLEKRKLVVQKKN